MKKTMKLALLAAVVASAGCNSFLTGDKLSNNPNRPSAATADQLFVGAQVSIMAEWQNYPLSVLLVWAQQIAGVARQWHDYGVYASGVDQFTGNGYWDDTYAAGGLIDMRQIDALTTQDGNLKLRGEERVLEALRIGTAADIWGPVPFDSAGYSTQPVFDSQADVYAHVLALLDSAVNDLDDGSAGALNDFFYGNDANKWMALAHTLKARFLMHMGCGYVSQSTCGQVLTETAQGINSADGTMQTSQTGNVGEENLWYSFASSRAGDVDGDSIHIALIQQAGEPDLLPVDYTPNSNGQYIGSNAGRPTSDPGGAAQLNMQPTTPIRIVSYDENQLLRAEAQFRTGDPASAQATLDNFRATACTDYACSQVGEGPAPIPGGANGILVAILREKYVRQFMNIEVLFDYQRTCYPNLPLPIGHDPSFTYIPVRFPFPYDEKVANPNVPAEVHPNGHTPAFPATDKDPTGAACIGHATTPAYDQ